VNVLDPDALEMNFKIINIQTWTIL